MIYAASFFKNMRYWWLTLGLLRAGLLLAQGDADIPFGSWRVHVPYADCKHLAETPERILAASENGLFSVGKADGEIRRLSAVDGFSDVGIAFMDYQSDADVVLIGYRNGNIDLIKNDNRIINLPDVLNSSLQGDKAIRHVHFRGNEAIISTGLGILILDLQREIFTDSYTSIGPGGSTVAVSATAVVNDTLYAAVSGAILYAPYDGSRNLSDYNNWKQLRSGVVCKNMVNWNNALVCDLNKVVQKYAQGSWSDYYDGRQDTIANIGVYYGKLYVFAEGRIISDDGTAQSIIPVNLINRGIVDREGFVWFVLNTYGLIKKINGNEVSFFPNGPAFKQSYQMASVGRTLYVTGGGTSSTYGNAFNNNGYAIFHENRWINRGPNPITDGLYDWTVAYAEPETKRVFLGTHSFGMVFFSGTEPRLRIDSSNSNLRKFANTIWTRVTGMASDQNGNLWVSNFGSATGLNVLMKTGGWKSYSLLNNNVGQLVVDDYGQKWMLAYNNSSTGPNGPVGLMVYDDNGTPDLLADDRQRFLNNQADNGGLPSSEVSCIATDRYGYIWVGTDQGLAVFTRPDKVFPNNKALNAERFVIVEGGTTGYLLGTQVINCITVDGGGRKWVGTNNGAYLVAENGLKVLRHFTKENSPLLSNEIQSIGIMEETGEVFFGSSEGISSWRGDATPAKDVHGTVKVFPNPVRPGYEGNVVIQGLPSDAEVKITDINGNVVYETRANGGTATWNCRKLNGDKPASGIYLIFSINRDGSDSYMSKLVFIR
jgi:hypothetical protein